MATITSADHQPSRGSLPGAILFLLFFLSGFCGLLYQVVWTRMAFASFGIITPVLSVVISVFMLGLSVGAWAGGRSIGGLTAKTGFSAVVFYAATEFMIGLGAFAVPRLFHLGENWLLGAGQTNSASYLFLSALVLTFSILPWCLLMGTTFPFMMAFVRESEPQNIESFSYLYVANVIGAMAGTFLTAVVLIESLGFHHTLWVAAGMNFGIAAIALSLAPKRSSVSLSSASVPAGADKRRALKQPQAMQPAMIRWILFSTGFCAMAMEVVWARAFTPVLKTQVYSFALVVFTYLGATALGSLLYRKDIRSGSVRSSAQLISWLVFGALLPVLANDPRFMRDYGTSAPQPLNALIVLLSICPICGVLGYLTPSLIDEYAQGAPEGAGKAYAINVLGCILGPLVASYILLPWLSERYGIILLSLPLLLFFALKWRSLKSGARLATGALTAAALCAALFVSGTFEDHIQSVTKRSLLLRDHVASVLAHGTGMDKRLLVNGIGMTHLTPVTKFMVHLPLAFHEGPSQSVLIICFGMGTTYRSALSWDVKTTAVELVPGVKKSFGFFHADADKIATSPNGRIVVDDGRRFLKRTREKFDVIVVDPPPPPGAAGSSLLYSEEFYDLAKEHLKPNGIIQAWFPGATDEITVQAVLRSIYASFPYVRRFGSVELSGMHLLASMQPIARRNGVELAARMPPKAAADLLEWNNSTTPDAYLQQVLDKEVAIQNGLNPDSSIRITDDRPFNEYFLLRRSGLLRMPSTTSAQAEISFR